MFSALHSLFSYLSCFSSSSCKTSTSISAYLQSNHCNLRIGNIPRRRHIAPTQGYSNLQANTACDSRYDVQTTVSSAMADAIPTQPVYLSGILLATFSFITMLLILPPMFWHFRNRNIGATVLIAWLVISLLINFVNALLWPSDDFNSWYNGVGLCDVEVKIQVASQVGLPASFACILRALAAIMDTDRATLYQTKAQKRRAYAIDLLCCIGLPSVQMFLHYVVQPHRYYIFGISGCVAAVNDSWLTILLIIVPPAIWIAIDAYFAGELPSDDIHIEIKLTNSSSHPHPTLPLPPLLQLHPRQQQHHQIPLHASLPPLPNLDPLLHPDRDIYILPKRHQTAKVLQLVRDTQCRELEAAYHGTKLWSGPL